MSLKVLQINTVAGQGSTGRIAETIGALALDQGFESYVAYGRAALNSRSQLVRIGDKRDILQHVALTRIFDKHGFGSKKATRELVERIKEINPDIIHLHNLHGYYLNIEILFDYLASADIPIIWTLHDCWSFTGHCAHFSYVGCEKWKSECIDCPQRKSYPSSILCDNSRENFIRKRELFTSVNNMTIVTVSKWLGGLVRESFLNKYPVEVIYNGIDTDTFSPRTNTAEIRSQYGITQKYMLLGAATAWSERKGLSAYAKLSEVLPDDYKIVLVGLTKEQIKVLPDKILGLERTNNVDELAALYSAADIVLNLSREETFGLTTAEGFACGTPSVVLDATASPELITPQTGLVVSQNNVESIMKAITEITSKGKDSFSQQCIVRAKECFNKDIQWQKYISMYKKVQGDE